ncbi:MAG: DUF5916 domain-containing protein [Kofleriaceae bacterium]
MFRFALVLAAIARVAHAQPDGVRAHAVKLEGTITVDGHLDEPCWQKAPKQTNFVQHFPGDGGKPAQQTSFAVIYDDKAIYVGVWSDDPEPDKLKALLTRRDTDALADEIIIAFDSYHDHRTAYMFQLNAAGVQRDSLMFDDSNQDDTWDAVWTGDAKINDHGWTAEFRIPLNQLRYKSNNTEWGFQVLRLVGRTSEQSVWSPWSRSAPQVVSRFGTLDGLDQLTQARRLELLPYATGGLDVAPEDPITHRVALKRGLGLDVKYGLGSAFTLSATINPDFGQVEADPSQINLGPSELFFAEKRPFFLEGVDLFKLPMGNSDGSVEGEFYSRRIGSVPDTSSLDYQYLRAPEATTIFGAMKLTGKADGFSVGVFDAVTGGEDAALIDDNGSRQNPMIATLTNYAVGRVKHDFNDSNSFVGASATAVDRDLSNTPLESLEHDQAYTGGLQVDHRWSKNAWEAKGQIMGSWVHGTEDAIANTQTENLHLYQRPDKKDATFDPMATSMSGLSANWKVGRMGDTKHWRFGFGGDVRTPGLELNDVGFQVASDQVVPFLFGQYHDETPGDTVLGWNVNTDVFTVNNFDPILMNYGWENNGYVQFANYWNFNWSANLYMNGLDPVALRGGPALRTDPNINPSIYITSDSRKKVIVGVGGYFSRDWTADALGGEIDTNATIQVRSNLDVAIGFGWGRQDNPMQYVTQVTDGANETHYITSRIDLTTLSTTIRANWTFSPHLSLQAYAQPYIAAGAYSKFKDVNNPHASQFSDRFHQLVNHEIRETDDTVFVDYNGAYSFDKPDFNFEQLRSTVVLRWEYRPGSSVFAIWSHGQTNSVVDGRFDLGHNLSDLAHTPAENIVMIKANYWIGL